MKAQEYRGMTGRFVKWRTVPFGNGRPTAACANLNAISCIEEANPWKLSFSYGRALQDEALRAWLEKSKNLDAGQQAFYHRARCDSAAVLGRYTSAMEGERAIA